MKRLLTIGIILLFIGSISSSTGLYLEKQTIKPLSSGNILYVGGNGTGNYTKIQDAIDNASNGDTVFVYNDSSPYYENLVLNKSITLVGEDRNSTIIDGNGTGNVIIIKNNHITISGFTLQNSGTGDFSCGVRLDNRNNNSIIGNKIINNQNGIYLIYSEWNNISNNVIVSSRQYGIWLHTESNNNTISNNIIRYNHWSGVFVQQTRDVVITKNVITNNENLGIEFYYAGGVISENIICNHTGDPKDPYSGAGILFDIGVCHIFKNTLKNNTYAFVAQECLTKIEMNNFIDNVNAIVMIFLENMFIYEKNKIERNNFIGNEYDAWFITFTEYIEVFMKYYLEDVCDWNENYWKRPRLLPKVIPGLNAFIIILLYDFIPFPLPITNIDRNPAQKPYDIDNEDILPDEKYSNYDNGFSDSTNKKYYNKFVFWNVGERE